MRIFRWTIFSLLCLAAVAGAGAMFLKGRRAIKQASPEYARRHGKPIPVRTITVSQSAVDEVVGATVVTEASQIAAIRIAANRLSPSREFKATAMRIKAVHIAEGGYVKEGDKLFDLDDSFLQQVLKQRNAEYTAVKAELELVKQSTALNQRIRELELTTAEANLDFRNEQVNSRDNLLQNLLKLHARTASTSLQVLDARAAFSQANFDLTEAKHRLQRAEDAARMGAMRDKLELEVATAKFEGAKFGMEMSQADLDACQIYSPAAGFVAQVPIVAGEVIDAGAELTKILQLDPIFVKVDFPQERIDDVAIGQRAEIVLDSYPKETFEGTVERISPQANTQLRIVPVIVKLENPRSRIKAGISGFARMHVSKTAVVVPSAAVIERGGRAMTFCVENGLARIRPIVTGSIVENGWIEVRSGLEPGSELVIYDTESLHDGDRVDLDWRKWARRE